MTEDEMMRKYAEAHGCENEGNIVSYCDFCGCNLKSWYKYCPNCGDELSDEESPVTETSRHVRPLSCVRDEHGEIREQTVKRLFAKIDEELNELKIAVIQEAMIDSDEKLDAIVEPVKYCPLPKFAEEAADTITAITTLLEALGIDAEMRDEAQRRVNAKNKERGRL